MSTPIQPVPDAVLASEFPSLSDRPAGTYNAKAKAWADSENAMATRTRDIASSAHNNAIVATEQADIATTKAGEASDDAEATAADRIATGLDAEATAADRVQTGLDRTQTGLDRAATAADRVQTGEDRQAVADGLASIADGPVFRVNGKAGDVELTATDIAPAATQAEMEAGTGTDPRSMSPKGVAQAIAALTPEASVGDHCVTVNTGNGLGSINTAIRRFTTIQSATGTAITYADSATLGASFTINEPGIYEVYYVDSYSGASAVTFGISLNSANLTSYIEGIPTSARVGLTAKPAPARAPGSLTRVLKLAAGDVIRPHVGGPLDVTTDGRPTFSIRKVGL